MRNLSRTSRILPAVVALVLALAGCGGGGGGGGGGGTVLVPLTGRVLWIESGSGTNPASTVRVGTESTTTDVIDGFFDFNAPTGSTQATVTYAPSSGAPIVRTFTFPALTAQTDLGDLYIGPQEVSVRGKAVDASDGSPVAGATVTLGGRRATSGSDGSFSVEKVAYSATNPAVFLGLDGVVSATNYFARHFSPQSLATGGVVQVGSIALTPLGSADPPPPPHTLQGQATPIGQGANATVEVLQSSVVVRSGKADDQGRYKFWLPTGTFTLRATKGASTAQVTFTVTSTNVIKTVNVQF